MKRIKYIAFFIGLICFSGCDFLEEDPKSFVSPDRFYKTESEVTAALYGCYRYRNYENVGDFGWQYIGDHGTDVTITRNVPRYMTYMAYLMESPTDDFAALYRVHYEGIGSINMLISRLTKSPVKETFRNQILGEAYYLRAFMYHHLVLMWGDVPMWLDELDLQDVARLSRSPKEEVIAQVRQDLSHAVELLGAESVEAGRVNKWTAMGLLARVALFDNDWACAYDLSNELIESSPYKLLDEYGKVFAPDNSKNSEVLGYIDYASDIFGSQIASGCSPRGRDEQANTNPMFHVGKVAVLPNGKSATANSDLFEGWGTMCIMEHLYESFEPGDSRRDMIWHKVDFTDGSSVHLTGGDGGGKGYYNLKYISFGDKSNNTNRDVIVSRLGEIFLIRAEAANELNKPEEAIISLNALRERAFGDSDHNYASGASKDQIAQWIRNENRLELWGEGLRRWYLIHWGFEYLKGAVELVKSESLISQQASDNLKAHHVLFKISEQEIQKNPNLTQNPGY